MSPKIIPRATSNPTGETFLIFKDIDATRSNFQMTGLLDMTGKSNKEKINARLFFYSSSSSTILLNLTVDTGATINGNFSTVTVERSRPNPFSSDKLTSLSQK